MKRWAGVLALLLFPLGGCRADLLPYAREIEDMSLVRTLGVDADADGVAVTAATGGQGLDDPALISGSAGTLSAALLEMQGEGDSYIYFGHVGQMLLGEDLARRGVGGGVGGVIVNGTAGGSSRGVGGALDYVMRDVEMRLDTELYVIQNGQAGTTISAAWQQDSAADRLETLHDGAGLRSDSMSRTVRNVLSDLERCGASFAPALTGDGTLSTAGYALLRDGVLVGWAEGAAAAGVNLLLSRVDADVVELPQADGTAALRVVGAKTRIRGVFDGEVLTGMDVKCRVEANLAEGAPALQEEAARRRLEAELAAVEQERILAALELCRTLEGDFFSLAGAAGLSQPWRAEALRRQWDPSSLEVSVSVTAKLERSYDAG